MPLKGLAALANFSKEQEARKAASGDRVPVKYFKFEKGVTVATVRFLQEFDEAAENYDERFGLAVTEIEHEAPGKEGFKARASCTKESEGFCYACERKSAEYVKDDTVNGNWKTKANTYIKALVTFDGSNPELMLISRNYNSTFVQALIQDAIDDNTVTDSNYRITKVGEKTETQWLLKKLRGEPFDVPDEIENDFSIEENVLRNIAYDAQPEWYGKVWRGRGATEAPVVVESEPETSNVQDSQGW